MTAVVIPRWTMRCDECGSMVTSIASVEDAEWLADEHNRELHADVEIRRGRDVIR